MKRLPIYFLIDTNFEIGSEPLLKMNKTLHLCISNFRKNPFFVESALISVNTMSENNYQINPLVELENINKIQLIATQSSFLGKAISMLGEFLQNQILSIENSDNTQWEPTVFIFLYNYPEDDFVKYINHFKKNRQQTVIIVFDQTINLKNIKLLSEIIINGNNNEFPDLSRFCWWPEEDLIYQSEKISLIKI
jgi:uncharacterized protein YegL